MPPPELDSLEPLEEGEDDSELNGELDSELDRLDDRDDDSELELLESELDEEDTSSVPQQCQKR